MAPGGEGGIQGQDRGVEASAHLFLFTNRRRTRCRIVYRERCGFVLWQVGALHAPVRRYESDLTERDAAIAKHDTEITRRDARN